MFTLPAWSWRRVALALLACVLGVALFGASVPGEAFAAGRGPAGSSARTATATDGAISGKVSGPAGAPLMPGTTGEVGLFTGSGRFLTVESFSDDGVYRLAGLATGDYKLGFYASSGYVLNWWRDANSLSAATLVHVVQGSTTGDINPQLVIGGTITGTVTGPGGTRLAADTSGSVTAYDRSGNEVGNGTFGTDGTYRIGGLGTGEVELQFRAWDGGGTPIYAPSWWRNAITTVTATPVRVTEGKETASIDQQLALAGSITGTVTGPTGEPLAAGTTGTVIVYTSSGTYLSQERFSADGSYAVKGLATGEYKINFRPDTADSGTAYEANWWQGATTIGWATPVRVVHGGVIGNISPRLPLTGSITGTVKGPQGAPLAAGTTGEVKVFTSVGTPVGVSSFSTDGRFTVRGLAAGDYKLKFETWDAGSSRNYVPGWWRNAATSATATVVHVGNGGVTGNIDPQLSLPGAITGTVSGPAGAPLVAGTTGEAIAYDSGGNPVGSGWFTDSGGYSISGLAAGVYTVKFTPVEGSERYVPGWWKNATSQAAATAVPVAEGSTSREISPQLALFGSISGTVSGPAGAPLDWGTNGEVSAYDSAGNLVSVQPFTGDGSYQVPKLIAGDYKLKIQAYDRNGNPGYQSSWWRNAGSQVTATAVHVTAGAATANINPQLAALPPSVASLRPLVSHVPGKLPSVVSASSRKSIKLPIKTDTGQLIRWASATPKVCTVATGKLRFTGKRALCRVTATTAMGSRPSLHREYRIRVY